ncbi:MAG TPA: YqhR family membrane protein [Bacillota bacterium]|nr:YqhR family membrane protein [Bacillota bacterium]
MSKNNRGWGQNSRSVLSRSLFTGFVGGLLWSILGVSMYYFNFSQVAPKTFFLRSWLKTDWTGNWLGDIVSIGMAGVLSILTAFIYYGLFKKINSMWMGAAYGMILWFMLFYVFKPILPHIPQLSAMDIHTIVSTLTVFILYGIFIGYSISYDYHDTILKEKQKNTFNT